MEACSLLTAADVEAALGEPFDEEVSAPRIRRPCATSSRRRIFGVLKGDTLLTPQCFEAAEKLAEIAAPKL